MLLAKQAATLDWLSKGRLLLGVGIGWMREEFEFVNAPFESRGGQTVESVELMRALWTGESVDFQGKYWQLSGAAMHPVPVQGSIPIIWGGANEVTLKRVARLGDGWHPLGLGLEELESSLKRLTVLCGEHGRDPRSLTIIAGGLGRGMPLTRENLAAMEGLGVNHLLTGGRMQSADLSDYLEEMERIAEVCELKARLRT